MTDFPPNPEDGELWLPSDVFHEIASTNLTLGANTDAAHFLVDHTKISTTTCSLPCATPNSEVSPYWIGSTANGAPNVNNHNSSYASWNGDFQLFPGTVHFFNPFTPTQTQLGIENYSWPLQCNAKCGGTGVFLPSSAESLGKFDNIQEAGRSGTGVFLNHQVVITARKKKKSKLLKT